MTFLETNGTLMFLVLSSIILGLIIYASNLQKITTQEIRRWMDALRVVEDILDKREKRLGELEFLFRKETAQVRAECLGKLDKIHVKSKIAEKYAVVAHDKALDAISRVGALENATHKVQFVPIEQKMKVNEDASKKLEKLLNPGAEEFSDWTAPFRTPDGEVEWV